MLSKKFFLDDKTIRIEAYVLIKLQKKGWNVRPANTKEND